MMLAVVSVVSVTSHAIDPMATNYDSAQCLGSWSPYTAPASPYELPDSLNPVIVVHVGRHGARYPTSPAATLKVLAALHRADTLGTITPLGRRLMALATDVNELSHNRWGDLDSLGMAEQRGIAARLFMRIPQLFNDKKVKASSTYVPRCVMSMYSFTHELSRLNNHLEIYTSSGRQNDTLLRPFEVNAAYIAYRNTKAVNSVFKPYSLSVLNKSMLTRFVGDSFPVDGDWVSLLMDCYHVAGGCAAMGVDVDMTQFFDRTQLNALWNCFNLRQYMQRCANTKSSVPGQLATPLIVHILNNLDAAAAGRNEYSAVLHFAHAETMIPLLDQLRLPGCFYLTNYFDTVGMHWRNWYVTPMATNLQLILCKSHGGNLYLVALLNEQAVTPLKDHEQVVVPYDTVREWLQRCIAQGEEAW